LFFFAGQPAVDAPFQPLSKSIRAQTGTVGIRQSTREDLFPDNDRHVTGLSQRVNGSFIYHKSKLSQG
jgi:hypothetical protein